MPSDDRVRLHDNQRCAPVPPSSGEGHPKKSVACPETASRRSVVGRQLLPQREVFQDQFPVAAERQRERPDHHDQQFQHAVIVAGVGAPFNSDQFWRESTYLNATLRGLHESMRTLEQSRAACKPLASTPARVPRPARKQAPASDGNSLIH
jgi:hypothetical protein